MDGEDLLLTMFTPFTVIGLGRYDGSGVVVQVWGVAGLRLRCDQVLIGVAGIKQANKKQAITYHRWLRTLVSS